MVKTCAVISSSRPGKTLSLRAGNSAQQGTDLSFFCAKIVQLFHSSYPSCFFFIPLSVPGVSLTP